MIQQPFKQFEIFYISCTREENDIFAERKSYTSFLEKIREALGEESDILAYALLPVQMHLLVAFAPGGTGLESALSVLKTLLPHACPVQNFEVKKIPTSELKEFIWFVHAKPVSEGFVRIMSRWEFSSYRAYIIGNLDLINRTKVLQLFDNNIENFMVYHRTHKLSTV